MYDTIFMCMGEGVGRGMSVSATINEQTKILRSKNKVHGKLTSAGTSKYITTSCITPI